MGKLEDIMLKTERGNPVREIASLDKKKKIWGGCLSLQLTFVKIKYYVHSRQSRVKLAIVLHMFCVCFTCDFEGWLDIHAAFCL